jgi:transglutaminase-like putative cysteine protease
LHREIPGDLRLGELPAGILSAPARPEAFEQFASETGWRDRTSAPPGDVIHPRQNWGSISRTMDDQTRSPTGVTLRYREVFTPSIAPFKRVHAFDTVDEMGRLAVRDPSLRPLRVGELPAAWSGAPIANFTGEVHVELSDTAPSTIPSVAAEQAVRSYRTEPEVPLAFFTDSAGNLFVRAESTRTVRLIYVLAAPQHAFVAPGARIPHLVAGSPSFHGTAPAPQVPPFLANDVPHVLQRVGARRTDPFRTVLHQLVGYFRNFRDAELTAPANASLYLRLATGGVGACRHRAYAFVLTLHALGVPARYVGNEAHAWAEVSIPTVGWSRIDLGGWDVNLRDESQQRAPFLPDNPDPFARPENYRNGYSTYTATAEDARRRARDAARDAGVPAQAPNASEPGTQRPAAASGGMSSAPGEAGAQSTLGAALRQGGSVGVRGGNVEGAPSTSPQGPRAAGANESTTTDGVVSEAPVEVERVPTVLQLRDVRSNGNTATRGVVRGTLVTCLGEARDANGAPVRDLPVHLELHGGGRRTYALGTTVTDAEGRFEAQVMLPLELDSGEYSVRARTPGDARHLAATAR